MLCRCCHQDVTGETCANVIALVEPHVYALMFNCSTCSATLAQVLWMSEFEALQRHHEEKRRRELQETRSALAEARASGASYAVIMRLAGREESLSYAE